MFVDWTYIIALTLSHDVGLSLRSWVHLRAVGLRVWMIGSVDVLIGVSIGDDSVVIILTGVGILLRGGE